MSYHAILVRADGSQFNVTISEALHTIREAVPIIMQRIDDDSSLTALKPMYQIRNYRLSPGLFKSDYLIYREVPE